MTQSRISITEPNGVQRMMPLSPRGLTIGRGSDNDVVINYPTTSRYHAQITFDGSYYYVTDLNSGNGSYLDNARLNPNEPVVWMPGARLQIGEVVIQQEQSQYQSQQPQQVQPQPGKPGKRERDRQNTETIAGWVPPGQQTQSKSSGRIWLIIVLVLVFLCICAGLAVGGYFYIFNG